jgi:myo-inositol 2-dehydrogenase / D-chiro-inositol 1-dehydrogenase
MRGVRVGIIGCGWVAQTGHLPALSRLPDVEVVAVADPDPVRLERTGDSFGIERRYPDHRGLVEDPAIDVVGVCVPAASHVEVATAAVEAGKHVLLEKPPALGTDEWDRLAATVAAAGVTFMVGLNMRWHPPFRAARELIRAGELGEIQCVRTVLVNHMLDRPEAPDWRSERRRGGGALMEMGIHHLDLWRFLLDVEVEEVFAISRGDDESLAVSGRMRSGVPVSSLFSQKTAQFNEVDVYGDAGRLTASPFSALRLLPNSKKPWTIGAKMADLRALTSLPHAVRDRRAGGFYVASFVGEWRHFLDAVARGTAVEVGLDSGRRLLQVALAVAASAGQRRSVACADAPSALAPVAEPAR